jgi:hypothetical protein
LPIHYVAHSHDACVSPEEEFTKASSTYGNGFIWKVVSAPTPYLLVSFLEDFSPVRLALAAMGYQTSQDYLKALTSRGASKPNDSSISQYLRGSC